MKRSIIALALAVASIAAHADYITDYVHAEVGAGVTRYGTENGRWYQENMPLNSVTNVAPEFSLGLTGPLVTRGRWGVDWHVDYTNLGRAAAACECTPIDDNYDLKSKRKKNTYAVDDAFFTGSGRAQGVVLSVEPYYWTHGVRLGVEAGAYVYRAAWTEYVAGWSQNQQMQKQSFELNDHSWNVAPVVGATVGNGRWTLAYRHYFMRLNANRATVPPVWNDADVLEVKFKF